MSKGHWASARLSLRALSKRCRAPGFMYRVRLKPQGEIDIETGASQAHDSGSDLERSRNRRSVRQCSRAARVLHFLCQPSRPNAPRLVARERKSGRNGRRCESARSRPATT